MMVRSLKNMAIDAIWENIHRYDKDNVKQIIALIRKDKFAEILNEAENHHLHCNDEENHIEKLWATLPFLVNSLNYTKFDTTFLTKMSCKNATLSNSRFQEFIRCLGSNTPNLVELKIESPRDLEHSLEERELASITQLQNLKWLIILNVCVPLSGLSEMTRRCRKIESIDATDVEIDVEPSGDTFSENFKFIVIFTVNLEDNRLGLSLETIKTIYLKFEGETRCMRLLLSPKRMDQLSKVRGFTKVTEIEFWSYELDDVERMDEFPHFPEVKFAHLHCDGKSAHGLRSFLKRNGQTLQKLAIDGVDAKENMTFAEVFSSCPNLESLNIRKSNLYGNNAPVEAMSRLKQFEWIRLFDASSDPVGFSSILSAPLLEEVRIDLPIYKIDFSDNATVIARIRRHEILQKIEKFVMTNQMGITRPTRVVCDSLYKDSIGICFSKNVS
ncbi:Hypothetical predicted protein [Cloeon dipterum]|uniref:Uncharacterized protein n=1 Tax=Cloeon dipterum TaxID=197152 RepID=A0A8S1E309_9INSE|nr:Hypothetical predicted protein [Cloeon dipterum]